MVNIIPYEEFISLALDYRNTYINSMSYWYIIGFTPSGPQQKLAVKTPLRLARIEGTDFAQHSGHQHSH